jgi:hypothetical protein
MALAAAKRPLSTCVDKGKVVGEDAAGHGHHEKPPHLKTTGIVARFLSGCKPFFALKRKIPFSSDSSFHDLSNISLTLAC